MKIADNPTSVLIRDRIAMLEEQAVTPGQKAEVAKLKKDYVELSTISDSFNSTFGSRGWIAYDSLNMRVIREALSIARSKGISYANDYLIDYYDQEAVKSGVTGLWGISSQAGLN